MILKIMVDLPLKWPYLTLKRIKLKQEVGDILKMKGRILLSTSLLGSFPVDFGLGLLKEARFERINDFALSTKSKFLYEAKLAVFSNHVIDYLIEDIMDKEPFISRKSIFFK